MKKSALKKLTGYEPYSSSSKLIKIGQASLLLGISIDTLRRWERKGWLKVVKTPGGTRLYDKEQLEKLNPNLKRGPKSLLSPLIFSQSLPIPPITQSSSISLSSDQTILKNINRLPSQILDYDSQKGMEFKDTLLSDVTEPFKLVRANLVTAALGLILISVLVLPLHLISNHLKGNQKILTLSQNIYNNPFVKANEFAQTLTGFFSSRVSQRLFGNSTRANRPGNLSEKLNEISDPASKLPPSLRNLAPGSVLAESSPSGSFLEINLDTVVNGLISANEASISGALSVSNVTYNFPDVQGGTLTFLQNDGGGNLTWTNVPQPGVATTTSTGIASFSTSFFTVSTEGAVGIKNGGITTTEILNGTIANSDLASSSITISPGSGISGGGAVSLGGSVTITSVLGSTVSLTSEVEGVLPIANGGSNKALTLAAGGVLWTDSDSFEVTAAGTSGQVLTSAGTGAPTWTTVAGLGVSWSSITDPTANLSLAHGTNTTAFASTATTGTFFTMTGNSLTSGTALALSSSATAFTGELASITLSGNNAANTGSLLTINNTGGTSNANTSLYIKHYGDGSGSLAFRIDDVSGDTTPFVVSNAGNVGVGLTTTSAKLHVAGSDGGTTLLTYSGPTISSFATNPQAAINNSMNSFSSLNSTDSLEYALSGVNQDNLTNNNTIGVGGLAYATNTSGVKPAAYGVYGAANNGSTGTVTKLAALYSFAFQDGAGTSSTMAGVYVDSNSRSAGTVTLNAGVYIADQSGVSTTATSNYQIYSAGTAASYFAGNVGINDTIPDAYLDIDSTRTTGLDFLITNTGIGTSGSVGQITANSYTSGDIFTLSGTALTSGSLAVLTGPSGGTAGVTDAALKITSDVGNIGTSNGLISSTAVFDGSSATGVNLYLTSSDAIAAANTDYGIYNSVTNTGAIDSAITKTSYGSYTSVSSTGGGPTTAGTTNVYGQYITTTATHAAAFGTVNQYGLYVADGTSSGNGTSTKYGLYVEDQSGANVNVDLNFTASPIVRIGDAGVLTFTEAGGNNTLCTLTDASNVGNLSCTGNITGSSSGTVGFWTRTSTTLSPATDNDIVLIDSTNTTGADLAITNTGIYTGTGIVNLTADAATAGTLFALSADGITTGKGIDLTSTSNALDSATLLNVSHSATAATDTTLSADIANLSFSPTYSTAVTTPAISGQVLDISRSVTTNSLFASTLTVSGALVSLSDSATQTTGTLTHTASVLDLTQNYTSSTGTTLYVKSYGGDTGYGFMVDDASGDTTPFVIENTGEVGIGTTAPGAALEVTGNILLSKEAARTIQVVDSTTADTIGANLTIKAAAGNGNNDGGRLILAAGAAGTGAGTNDGGLLSITSGAAGVNGTGGALNITSGAGPSNSTSNASGALTLKTGTSGSGSPTGSTTLSTGDATSDFSGSLTLSTGATTTSGASGAISIASGNAAGNSGNISIDVGTTGATAGTISIGTANAQTLNLGLTGSGTSSIVMSGGSADTGCTLDGSNGNFTCSGTVAGTTPLSSITAATTTATIANANNAIVWNWGTLTTETGMTFGGGTAMTSGSIFTVGGATYVHTALNDVGELMNLSFTDASTNANNGGTTIGLNIASTINTTGAGTKSIKGINIATPTKTTCTTGACTWTGLAVEDPGTLANATFYAATFAGGNVGIGTTAPATILDVDTASNSLGLRLRGTAETTEISDIYTGSSGELILSTIAGADTAQYIDLKPEDNEWGLVLRDGAGATSVYTNFYMNDAATDYLNIVLNASNATAGLVLDNNGNVGIGDITPESRLKITSSSPILRMEATGGSPQIQLDSDYGANNAHIYQRGSAAAGCGAGCLAFSVDSGTAEPFFINQSNNVGVSTLAAAAATHVCRDTNNLLSTCSADYPEWYPSDGNVEIGDVVVSTDIPNSISDDYSKTLMVKSSGPYDAKIIGIVADPARGASGGERKADFYMPLVLAGRVPLKVSTENGPIKSGDYLTSSSTPGVAMKATRPGPTVAKALEDYNSSGTGKIIAFVNVSYADPSNALANLTFDTDGSLIVPKLKAEKLVISDSLVVNGSLKANSVSIDASTLNLTGSLASITPDSEGKVSIAQALNAISDQQSAISSQVLGLESASASQSAQIAQSSQIAQQAVAQAQSLDEKVASTSANLASLSEQIQDLLNQTSDPSVSSNSFDLTPPDLLTATGSASLTTGGSATLANLNVTEKISTLDLEALDATVSATFKSLGQTFLGQTTVAGDLSVDGTLSFSQNSINAISTLYLQNNPLSSSIDIFNGKVTINKDGQVSADSLALGNQSLGEATIPAGQTEITINTSLISPASRIFLTALNPLSGNLYADYITPGQSFKAKLSQPNTEDVKFNWLVIGEK